MKSSVQDIHAAYTHFEQICTQYGDSPRASESAILIRDFQEKALGALTNLTEAATQGHVVHLHGRAAEDRVQAILERFARRSREVLRAPLPSSPIPSVEDLLSRMNGVISKLLERNILRVPFRIYPLPPDSRTGIIPGSGEGIDPAQAAPKYSILIDILLRHGIDPVHDVTIVEERLDDNQMRALPYKIVYVRLPSGVRTVCVSDEVGERTYVYDGMVSLNMWRDSEKGKPMSGIATRGVQYGDRYANKLEQAVFGTWEVLENPRTQDSKVSLNTQTTIDTDAPLHNILLWQSQILEAQEVLAGAKIVYEDGIWYFEDAKWSNTWPRVGGKKLASFPNAPFNKKNGIGNDWWVITNSQELSRVFAALGLRVATDEEQRRYWARMLETAKAELAKAGIVCEDGIWYFEDAKWFKKWPMVGEKGLVNFPNSVFNKKNKIGNPWWNIGNSQELSRMFAALGLRVATDEEQRRYWARMLEMAETKLAEVGIVCEDGIWYFKDAKWSAHWPRVGGKNLRQFPSAVFNKENGIGNDWWVIVSVQELSRMFAALGLRVATDEKHPNMFAALGLRAATDEEQRQYWARMLEMAKAELAKAGIVCEDDIWYFEDAKWSRSWPKVGGKKLASFPSATFNKKNGIGNDLWLIISLQELSRMFAALGLRVATDEEQRRYWARMLETAETKLAEVGIVCEDGIWYFEDAKWSRSWPKVGENGLVNFPNSVFNKKNKIGNQWWAITNSQELSRMFAALGLRVATPDEERVRKAH